MLMISGFWALGEWTDIFYRISSMVIGIFILYRNRKNREKFKNANISMIYNSKKYRKKFRNLELFAILFIIVGILLIIRYITINLLNYY